jgi:ZIP family zinc transporter
MIPILLALAAFGSTILGGFTALKYKDNLHRLLGYTSGVILGVLAFDLLPEIFELLHDLDKSATGAMIALVSGFLLFHIVEKSILIHHSREHEYQEHHHPTVGIASALALAGHSFLDGVAIGFAFQVDSSVGIAVALAVIAHDFSDGLNAVSLMLAHENRNKRTLQMLLLVAVAPILGVLSTQLVTVPEEWLVLYLGFFAGFLLYIGASEILPEAHSKHSSYKTIALTVLGVVFMFIVTRFLEHAH